jgi:type IV pilus assembly protein PilC
MAETGKFSPYEFYSIEIGEETGTLNTVVKYLVSYYARVIEQKRKIISAFSYPVLVLLTAFGALSFMLGFVVPMFEEIFTRYGHDLPWITQIVVSISRYFTDNGLMIVFIAIIFVIFIFYLLKLPVVKKNLSFVLLKIPYFGELLQKIILLRFCTAFELLSKAHTPLSESLELLQKMITFYPIAISFEGIKQNIRKGESLYNSMKLYPIYDKRMLSLIRVAEQVNRLDQTFETLKEQYTEEINYKTTMMGNVLEPVLIILVGSIVGLILISMYLPIFEFSSSVSV